MDWNNSCAFRNVLVASNQCITSLNSSPNVHWEESKSGFTIPMDNSASAPGCLANSWTNQLILPHFQFQSCILCWFRCDIDLIRSRNAIWVGKIPFNTGPNAAASEHEYRRKKFINTWRKYSSSNSENIRLDNYTATSFGFVRVVDWLLVFGVKGILHLFYKCH
jgi:hypothetical protein